MYFLPRRFSKIALALVVSFLICDSFMAAVTNPKNASIPRDENQSITVTLNSFANDKEDERLQEKEDKRGIKEEGSLNDTKNTSTSIENTETPDQGTVPAIIDVLNKSIGKVLQFSTDLVGIILTTIAIIGLLINFFFLFIFLLMTFTLVQTFGRFDFYPDDGVLGSFCGSVSYVGFCLDSFAYLSDDLGSGGLALINPFR